MSDTGWTKGPWSAVDHGVGELVVYEEGTQDAICTLDDSDDHYGWKDCYSTSPEARHNANLIAAAPELYEALGTMMAMARTKWGNLDEDFNLIYAEARRIRAKARGETQ